MHAHIHTHIQAFKYSHIVLHRKWEQPTLAWAKKMVSLHGHVLRPAIQPSSSVTIQLFVFKLAIEPFSPTSHTITLPIISIINISNQIGRAHV